MESIRSEPARLGDLQSITLVRFEQEEQEIDALYRLEFAAGLLINRVRTDTEGRIADFVVEAFEPKGRAYITE